ncbi:MAG: hypothetical protein EZS28_020094 [Streblomastix strix]|uniref:Uncharacterized protein n=1 Tax=Streblomastix strix TaxID=222440 RepID=A0A5J4VP65_9EUKA|nr:MAG: hypothetical protein EZS28_020094 [Streblomastix strix]
MEGMANIDLSVSIIDDEDQTATVCFPPKQSRKRESYDVRRTNDPRVCQTETFFQADQRYISIRLGGLVQIHKINSATANSIRHASSTELAAQSFDGRIINVFTHHTPDSKMNQNFYIFAVNMGQDSIASALANNHVEKQVTQIISKQGGGTRISEGDILQQCPLGDGLQLSPQGTLASPLFLPIILIQSIVKAESTNDHKTAKDQKSQMQKEDQVVEQQKEAQNLNMTKILIEQQLQRIKNDE